MGRIMRASSSPPPDSFEEPEQLEQGSSSQPVPTKKRKAEVINSSDEEEDDEQQADDELTAIPSDEEDGDEDATEEEAVDNGAVVAHAAPLNPGAVPFNPRYRARLAPRKPPTKLVKKRAKKRATTKAQRKSERQSKTSNALAAPKPAKRKPRRRGQARADFSTFHLFGNLAPEIRLKIWGMAADADKAWLVQVRAAQYTRHRKHFSIMRTGRPVPALLHVCREARAACIEDDPLDLREQAKQAQAELKAKVAAAADRGAKTYRQALKIIAEDAAAEREERPEIVKKTFHAKWKLYEWDNSTNNHLYPPKLRVYFSARNDTFWGISTSLGWRRAVEIPMAAQLQHFASRGAVGHLTDLAVLRTYFPQLQSVTCLLNDAIYYPPNLYMGTRGRREYFPLQPEVRGQLSIEGLERGRAEVVTAISTASVAAKGTWQNRGVWGGGDANAELPEFGEEETSELKAMLKFRFEVQVVQNEVVELKRMSRYKRTPEMLGLGGGEDGENDGDDENDEGDVGGEDGDAL